MRTRDLREKKVKKNKNETFPNAGIRMFRKHSQDFRKFPKNSIFQRFGNGSVSGSRLGRAAAVHGRPPYFAAPPPAAPARGRWSSPRRRWDPPALRARGREWPAADPEHLVPLLLRQRTARSGGHSHVGGGAASSRGRTSGAAGGTSPRGHTRLASLLQREDGMARQRRVSERVRGTCAKRSASWRVCPPAAQRWDLLASLRRIGYVSRHGEPHPKFPEMVRTRSWHF